jgi:hypothetical protein
MPVRPRSPARAVLGALLACAVLAGCGGSSSAGNGIASESPAKILAAARAAADAAATVHIAGAAVVSKGTPSSIDMELLKGKGGRGRIRSEGVSVELIRIERAVYIKGNLAFERRIAGPTVARRLQDKWIKAPENSGNFASFASVTDLRALLDSTLASHGKLENAGTRVLDGHSVVALRDVSSGETLYVASTGAPYPIEVVKDGGSGGRIVFDRWNKPVTLTAPANAININQLQSGH